MTMKSVMSHAFSQLPDVKIQRSKFNRSFAHKTTFNSGYIIPLMVDEALPGDTFIVKATLFGRIATLLKPIMDNVFLDTFFFSVPYRLVWENWEKFNGQKDNHDDTTEYVCPIIAAPAVTGWGELSMADYFGIPTKVPNLETNSFAFRAYNLIYNEWFKDQNILDNAVVDKTDTDGTPADYVLKRRGKRHDYFTSCLPWPQKGDAVTIPLGDEAPVLGIGGLNSTFPDSGNTVYESNEATRVYTASKIVDEDNATSTRLVVERKGETNYPYIRADLSDATAATINSLRQAFQVQRLLERDARSGTRYVEMIRSHFGVVTPSQGWRTEYLGGGSQRINVSPIAQTAIDDGSSPVGTLRAIGTVSTQNGFVKSFTEHCLIMGFVNVRADLTYQQGLDRMWSRSTRYDFYLPVLSHLGEQAVLQKEIFADANPAHDDLVFGYQERFACYRYKKSMITGLFRSNATASLDNWHLSQEFANAPTLSAEFIEDNPPMSRVIAVPTEPEIILDSYFDMQCIRPMPVYSEPGYMDHF